MTAQELRRLKRLRPRPEGGVVVDSFDLGRLLAAAERMTRCPKCGRKLVCHRCVSVKGGSRSTEAKRAASRLTIVKARETLLRSRQSAANLVQES